MSSLIAQLERLAGNLHKFPLSAAIVNAAIQRLTINQSEICSLKGEIAMLAELFEKIEADKTAALKTADDQHAVDVAALKDAAAKELTDLAAAGRLLSVEDAAVLQAELAKHGLNVVAPGV